MEKNTFKEVFYVEITLGIWVHNYLQFNGVIVIISFALTSKNFELILVIDSDWWSPWNPIFILVYIHFYFLRIPVPNFIINYKTKDTQKLNSNYLHKILTKSVLKVLKKREFFYQRLRRHMSHKICVCLVLPVGNKFCYPKTAFDNARKKTKSIIPVFYTWLGISYVRNYF